MSREEIKKKIEELEKEYLTFSELAAIARDNMSRAGVKINILQMELDEPILTIKDMKLGYRFYVNGHISEYVILNMDGRQIVYCLETGEESELITMSSTKEVSLTKF